MGRRFALLVGASALLLTSAARAQDLGHKVPGTLGLFAGREPDPGLVLADQLAFYSANRLRDRFGNPAAVVGFNLDAIANGFIPPIRTRIALRWEHDFAVESRPEGQVVTLTATFLAWRPDNR